MSQPKSNEELIAEAVERFQSSWDNDWFENENLIKTKDWLRTILAQKDAEVVEAIEKIRNEWSGCYCKDIECPPCNYCDRSELLDAVKEAILTPKE